MYTHYGEFYPYTDRTRTVRLGIYTHYGEFYPYTDRTRTVRLGIYTSIRVSSTKG